MHSEYILLTCHRSFLRTSLLGDSVRFDGFQPLHKGRVAEVVQRVQGIRNHISKIFYNKKIYCRDRSEYI